MEYPGFDEFWVGVYFAVPSVIYVMNTPLVYFYCKFLSRRFVVFIGSAIFCLSIYLIGTSPMFGFQNNSTIIFWGLFGLGLGAAMISIPIFPEMLSSIEQRYPEIAGDELNNISAGYFNSCLGMGEALGPMSASLLGQ